MKTFNALFAVAVLALGATQLSCSVNDYCLNCGTGDGGMGSGDGDANDGGGSGDIDAAIDAACVPTGSETCDGKDNDCNGLVDDGNLPEVGELCANQMGACSGGTKICDPASGTIKCDKTPKPEACNNVDDNCNGAVDEGDPGGGGLCGTQAGACVAGTERCTNGTVQCIGFQDHTGDDEVCNGQDDDCNDLIDDNVPSAGACGPTKSDGVTINTDGECEAGAYQCVGGVSKCIGAVFPKFETCNTKDDDCDGVVDQIFNTQTDPNNCGGCIGFGGVVCATPSKTCVNATNAGATCTDVSMCTGSAGNKACVVNATPKCTTGTCGIRCNAGFYDINGNPADGCEYKCSKTGPEECDGVDNDCDGLVDRTATNQPLTPPANLCEDGGECAVGLTGGKTRPDAVCSGTGGWTCSYLGAVEFPEESCDGKNNDCDANTDESHFPDAAVDSPRHFKGAVCSDKEPGQCLDVGTWQCDTANPKGNLICDYTTNNKDLPFGTSNPKPDEDCNAKDDDCDGQVDEQIVTGQEWVSIGNNVQMMAYEASRPDATSTLAGSTETIACSRPNAQPWTNVTYPEAVAACASAGGRLCTEQEWHRTCSVVTSPSYPLSVNNTGVLIEAENYSGITPRNTRAWVPDYTVAPGNTNSNGTFIGISAMEATPNNGGNITAANAKTQSPQLDYSLSITAAGTYHVWVRMFANNANDNTVFVGLSSTATPVAVTAGTNNQWIWVDAASTFTVTAGQVPLATTLSVWMGKDGTKVDQIMITTSASAPTDPSRASIDGYNGTSTPTTPNSRGGTWAFTSPADPYTFSDTCNGDDHDTSGATGDQDDILASKSLPNCRANVGTGIYDMSGNVKEWTAAHQAGENPIRGGASNNTATGISCGLNFTLADDTLLLPNIGFRCCK